MSDDLQQKVTKGVQARQQIDEYKPYLAKRQKVYLTELLMRARTGEPTESAVYKLLALDDVVNDLEQDIQTGKKAAQKLNDKTLKLANRVENG